MSLIFNAWRLIFLFDTESRAPLCDSARLFIVEQILELGGVNFSRF